MKLNEKTNQSKAKQRDTYTQIVNVMNPSKIKYHHFVPWDRILENLEHSTEKAMFFFPFLWCVRIIVSKLAGGSNGINCYNVRMTIELPSKANNLSF